MLLEDIQAGSGRVASESAIHSVPESVKLQDFTHSDKAKWMESSQAAETGRTRYYVLRQIG